MKLVIDIPEKVVTAIQNGEDYRFDIHTAIAQGTLLPKVHGRIGDLDAVMNDIERSIDEMTNIGIAVDGEYLWGKLNNAIYNAQIIIPAESEKAVKV